MAALLKTLKQMSFKTTLKTGKELEDRTWRGNLFQKVGA